MPENQENRGGNPSGRNPAENLTNEDRRRGGERSASMQSRDAHGQFAGSRAGQGSTGSRRSEGAEGEGGSHGRASEGKPSGSERGASIDRGSIDR